MAKRQRAAQEEDMMQDEGFDLLMPTQKRAIVDRRARATRPPPIHNLSHYIWMMIMSFIHIEDMFQMANYMACSGMLHACRAWLREYMGHCEAYYAIDKEEEMELLEMARFGQHKDAGYDEDYGITTYVMDPYTYEKVLKRDVTRDPEDSDYDEELQVLAMTLDVARDAMAAPKQTRRMKNFSTKLHLCTLKR